MANEARDAGKPNIGPFVSRGSTSDFLIYRGHGVWSLESDPMVRTNGSSDAMARMIAGGKFAKASTR